MRSLAASNSGVGGNCSQTIRSAVFSASRIAENRFFVTCAPVFPSGKIFVAVYSGVLFERQRTAAFFSWVNEFTRTNMGAFVKGQLLDVSATYIGHVGI